MSVATGGKGMMRILRDQAGSVFPLAAVTLVVLAGMVGGGVDISRAYMAENRLQNACDAGVLAGRKAVGSNGFDSAAEAQADLFFNTNFDADEQDVTSLVFNATDEDDGNVVNGSASATMDTVVMQLFGYDSIPLSVNCSASMSIGNSDVMMVMDITGSMMWTIGGNETSNDSVRRITYLRAAMKDFYDTIATATAGGNGRVRFAFVPYSQTVNVGEILTDLDSSYIADSWSYQSREPVYKTTTHQELSGYEPPYYTSDSGYNNSSSSSWYYVDSVRHRSLSACESAQPADTSWANHGSSSSSTTTYINSQKQRVTETTTTQPQRRTVYDCYRQSSSKYYVIYQYNYRNYYQSEFAIENPIYTTYTTSVFDHWNYKQRTLDTSVFKTFTAVNTNTGSSGSNQSSTWNGCIEERETVNAASFSFSSLTGISPSGANDLDIDSAPSDAATRWGPQWSQISYYRTNSNGNYLTSNATSEYGRKASSACPSASQLFDVMTEEEFDAYADALSPTGSTYHDIGMIWGARLSSPTGINSANVNDLPANGGSVARHIIFMTDGEMAPSYTTHSAYGIEYHDQRVTTDGYSGITSRHNSRFRAVCEAAKAKGIRIWVIAFASALTSDLVACASTDSSFLAADADQLNEAFQTIGKTVGELRVVQ